MSGRSSPRDGEGDDFTRISGIGTVLDRRLHQAGVNSYADLAALNPEGISSLLADTGAIRPGRIGGEDWTGQAARLAEEAAMAEGGAAEAGAAEEAAMAEGGAAEAGTAAREARDVASATAQGAPASLPEASAARDATGLHYQSFVVRILLHESDGRIASTTVQHVGSGTERRWPGLDKPALLDFISVFLSPGPAEHGRPELLAPRPPGEQAVQPEEELVTRPAHADATEDVEAGNSAPPRPGSSTTSREVSLTLARELRVPRSGEPFTVSISLDLTDVEPPAAPRVGFSAVVLARPLGGAAPQVVSQGKGIIPADAPVITLHSSGLPAGTYRLEAVVELIESHGRTRDLVASMEGGILVVSGPVAEPSPGTQLQRIP
jgi:hypothetical protein